MNNSRNDCKRAVLITSHVWESKRKAGFHWMADSLIRDGWEVYFVTGLTTVDAVKKDYRSIFVKKYGKNKLYQSGPNIYSYIWYNLIRPIDFRVNVLNSLLSPLFYLYKYLPIGSLRSVFKSADLIIFESTYELMLFDRVKKVNNHAKFIYRVSDDMSLRNVHPVALMEEKKIANKFDLISTPTSSIYDRFSNLPNSKLQLHGAPLHLYEKAHSSPYQDGLNAVFVGSNFFDQQFLFQAATMYPNIKFHIIGPIQLDIDLANIYKYGEMAYEKTIPFVKFADIALSPMLTSSFADSNKIIQYTHCKLPIIISSINRSSRENFIYYEIGNEGTISESFNKAINFDRDSCNFAPSRSWDDLMNEILL